MKKNVIIILLLSLSTLSISAKTLGGGEVDPAIERKFKTQFGSTVKVSWEIVDGVSIGTYSDQGQEKQVYYTSDGEIFAFGKSISKDLLPESIGNAISKKFNSGVIETVYELKSTDSPTRYYIRVATSRYLVVLSANEFGELGISQRLRAK